MKYETHATSAVTAGLQPATIAQTVERWRELGVTRQTAHRWRSNDALVPLMARLAAAWLMRGDVR